MRCRWDGYDDRVIGSIAGIVNRKVDNVVVLTGDAHANYAADLKAPFDDPTSRTLGSEFAGTSLASGGNGSDTTTGTATQLAENLQMKVHNAQRGYVKCRVTDRVWRSGLHAPRRRSRRRIRRNLHARELRGRARPAWLAGGVMRPTMSRMRQ